jgi:hypothetical protein
MTPKDGVGTAVTPQKKGSELETHPIPATNNNIRQSHQSICKLLGLNKI